MESNSNLALLRQVQDQEAKVIDGRDAFGPVFVPEQKRFCVQVEFSVDATSYDEAVALTTEALVAVAVMGEGWDPDVHVHELVS